MQSVGLHKGCQQRLRILQNGPCHATPMDIEEQDSPSLDNSSQQRKPERPSLEGIIAPKALSFDTIPIWSDTHLSQVEASSLPGPHPIIMSAYALQNTGLPPPPIQECQPGKASAIQYNLKNFRLPMSRVIRLSDTASHCAESSTDSVSSPSDQVVKLHNKVPNSAPSPSQSARLPSRNGKAALLRARQFAASRKRAIPDLSPPTGS